MSTTHSTTIEEIAHVLAHIVPDITAASLLWQEQEGEDEDMSTTTSTTTHTGDYNYTWDTRDLWYSPSTSGDDSLTYQPYVWTSSTTDDFSSTTITIPGVTDTTPCIKVKMDTAVYEKAEEVAKVYREVKAVEMAIGELVGRGEEANQAEKDRLYRLYGKVWLNYMVRVRELLGLLGEKEEKQSDSEESLEEISERYEGKRRGRYRLDI